MSIRVSGPKFQIESDKAMIVLGHSERHAVGEFLARSIDERRIFENIDVITLNRAAGHIGRTAIRQAMKTSTVITHSASVVRVPEALQIIAFNPPEPVPLMPLLKRGMFEIPKDLIGSEVGANKTGPVDMIKAGLELASSPVTTCQTVFGITGGYSSTERLVNGAESFPAGRAMVHSELDAFGFAQLADMDTAARAGITTVVLPDHYHNELLYASNRTLDLLTPVIFPASK